MRTFASMLVLTMLITCSFQASAQSESIYSDIVWDTDRTHSGEIVIAEGVADYRKFSGHDGRRFAYSRR